MKKILSVTLVLVMLGCMALSVFAENGGFINSRPGQQAPELVEGKNESEDCTAQLLVISYADKDSLPAEVRQELEKVYEDVLQNSDISNLNQEIKDVAEENGAKVSELAVSDVFDISCDDENCQDHSSHGKFTVVLKSETLKNFVCLLHYYDGAYHVVKDAKVSADGQSLEFTTDGFSPFLVVTKVEADAPVTTAPVEKPGENETSFFATYWWVFVIVAVLIVLAIVIIAPKKKTKK